MTSGFGVRSALRVSAWLSAWSKHDPNQSHLHLGPIGVDPAAQGRRIGHQLMQRYCEQLDRRSEEGYLETAAEIPVLGVPNYLMSRAKST